MDLTMIIILLGVIIAAGALLTMILLERKSKKATLLAFKSFEESFAAIAENSKVIGQEWRLGSMPHLKTLLKESQIVAQYIWNSGEQESLGFLPFKLLKQELETFFDKVEGLYIQKPLGEGRHFTQILCLQRNGEKIYALVEYQENGYNAGYYENGEGIREYAHDVQEGIRVKVNIVRKIVFLFPQLSDIKEKKLKNITSAGFYNLILKESEKTEITPAHIYHLIQQNSRQGKVLDIARISTQKMAKYFVNPDKTWPEIELKFRGKSYKVTGKKAFAFVTKAIVEGRSNLMITGKYGAGKSSAMHWLQVQLSQLYTDEPWDEDELGVRVIQASQENIKHLLSAEGGMLQQRLAHEDNILNVFFIDDAVSLLSNKELHNLLAKSMEGAEKEIFNMVFVMAFNPEDFKNLPEDILRLGRGDMQMVLNTLNKEQAKEKAEYIEEYELTDKQSYDFDGLDETLKTKKSKGVLLNEVYSHVQDHDLLAILEQELEDISEDVLPEIQAIDDPVRPESSATKKPALRRRSQTKRPIRSLSSLKKLSELSGEDEELSN
jgi:hypothetical protein